MQIVIEQLAVMKSGITPILTGKRKVLRTLAEIFDG